MLLVRMPREAVLPCCNGLGSCHPDEASYSTTHITVGFFVQALSLGGACSGTRLVEDHVFELLTPKAFLTSAARRVPMSALDTFEKLSAHPIARFATSLCNGRQVSVQHVARLCEKEKSLFPACNQRKVLNSKMHPLRSGCEIPTRPRGQKS